MELNRKQIISELEGLAKFITCPEYIKNALSLIEELTEENEELHASCTELEQTCKKWQSRLDIECKYTKADTVKKMRERLQMYFGTYVIGYKIALYDVLRVINQIAKEMLEDLKNERKD